MLAYFLFALLILGVFTAFVRSRKSLEKRHWTNQTTSEKILLSIALAGIFQFLFMLPGWVVAVSIIGYSGGQGETVLSNFLGLIIMLTANTLIYSPFIYLTLKLLLWFYRKQEFFD